MKRFKYLFLAMFLIGCKPVVDTATAQEPAPRTGGAAVEVTLDDMINDNQILKVLPMINFVALACLDKGALDFGCVQYLSENLDLTSPVLSAKELVKAYRQQGEEQ